MAFPSSSRRPSSLLPRVPPSGPSRSSNSKGRRGRAAAAAVHQRPTLPEPVYDEAYIRDTYELKPVKDIWVENPKSPLANCCRDKLKTKPVYESTLGVAANGQTVWRTSVQIQTSDMHILAYGDHALRKESERLAALSAVLQLDGHGVLSAKQPKAPLQEPTFSPIEVTFPDGSKVDFEKARQFMEYYCHRFGFGRPEVNYSPYQVPQKVGSATAWQAEMIVDGRRIGFSKGSNKKNATMSCYVDVTQYLEQCDSDIWKEFLKDSKTGKDLGLAPRVLFTIDDVLQDRIADLCSDIKKSKLYQSRPSSKSADGKVTSSAVSTGPRALYRRPVPLTYLEDKSKELTQRREAHLISTDPRIVKLREQRAGLPVYTKSEELLQHIRDHEVTICMAATGSGKTTQIPQLILDDMIDRGQGARCNIVCTQPRRIAAISVADRVAKERGESAGRGSSIGYQVRFEHNMPDEHGSVTFCTTGIFLKRMQTALEGYSSIGRSLDDVTHILVDEVHERDVDTDLLLVVLKRLLADRKARGKPLKVVLMSATINPTLFQEYFPDEQNRPASVIDIPGRAFPVEKKFLDDFLPELQKQRSAAWVFQEESVQRYLTHQLGSTAAAAISGVPLRKGGRQHASDTPTLPAIGPDNARDDDLDMPVPLVALTIAHVMRRSDEGHVLVFLPGWDDITAVQKCLLGNGGPLLDINFSNSSRYNIHLLHSSIPIAEQQAIFEPPPQGVRRIILATNIAETSVTIPDVVYVVDAARVKEQRYEPERHISALVSAWVGSSNLNQRAGRAGRHRPGEYYGILTRQFSEALHTHQTVEMKRVDLSNVVMHVKALNFPGMTVEQVLAETIEPPPVQRVKAAMKALEMVGALDGNHNLTSLGRVLLQIPVDVQMGRLVLYGSFFRCLDQALTLAAILTNRDPFLAPMHLKTEAAARKNSFTTDEFRSDALATLRAYDQWWDLQSRGHYVQANRFCQDNFLAKPTLLMIQKIKDHLLQSLYTIGVIDLSAGGSLGRFGPRRDGIPPELNSNANFLPLLAALIAIATQPKFAIRTGEKMYRTATDKRVFIHPSSVNHRRRERLDQDDPNVVPGEKQIIAYAEKRQNLSSGQSHPEMFLVTTSRLDPLTYILFGAYNIEVTFRGLECDEWLPIVGGQDALDDVERLKRLMEACMLRVFEGIIAGKAKPDHRRLPLPTREVREDESGDEDEDLPQDRSLSGMEIKELDVMTRDIVRVLNEYSTYRVAMQSQHNSRPATPMDSPSWSSSRLPGFRSGHTTPAYNIGSAYSSRPSTPSRLSASRKR